jgi:uncharacterized membrane protein
VDSFITFFGILLLAYLILPWICLVKISNLRRDVNELFSRLPQSSIIKERKTKEFADISDFDFAIPKKPTKKTETILKEEKVEEPPFEFEPIKKKEIIEQTLEQKFGMNFFVWLGGIALALAGIYLVKYSIENNLVSVQMRIIFGATFGAALLFAGRFISDKGEAIANGQRISQALIGASIIDFYACFYSASNLFHLIGPTQGFIGMAGITLLAIIMSVRYGPPIAILGLIGGFITPSLFASDHPQASVLFIYLFFIVCGLFSLIAMMGWWFIGAIVVIFSYLWVGIWLCTSFVESDSLWLSLFIIGVCIAAVSSSKYSMKKDGELALRTISTSAIAILGGMFMLAWVAKTGGMRLEDWVYYGFISLFAMGFSYFEQGKYTYVSWIAMIVNALMLITWESNPQQMFFVILAFNILFSLPAYFAMLSRREPETWALLGAVTNIGYFFLAYWKTFTGFVVSINFFWGLFAFIFALLALGLLNFMIEKKESYDRETYKKLVSIFAVSCVTFITAGLFVEVDKKFFHLVLASEILIISWINSRPMHLEALRYTVGILLGLIAIALLDHIYRIGGNFTTYQLFGNIRGSYKLDFVTNPYLHYGLQTIALSLSTIYLLKEKDSKLVKFVEGFAIISLLLFGTFAISNFFSSPETSVGLLERGILNFFYLLVGLSLIYGHQIIGRFSLFAWGAFIVSYAIFRITFLDLLHFNPISSPEHVGSLPIFNKLLISYGLPLLLIYKAANTQEIQTFKNIHKAWSIFLFVLMMFYVSINIRQFFHGEYLNTSITSSAEMYSYSIAWLVLGIILAFAGAISQNRTTSIASVIVVTLTIGKVFLLDAKELEGLFRVFSFFGLGISLLGLSYFYSRFVFRK